MTRLRDTIEQLERQIDKDGGNFLSRRRLLRGAFEAVQSGAWRDGYHEGMCDAQDAQRAAERETLNGIMEHSAGGESGDG